MEEETSLKEVLMFLLKKCYVAIIVTALVVGGRELYARRGPEVITYTSTAQVLVTNDGEKENSEPGDGLVGTYAEIAKSRESMERMKENLSLEIGTDILMSEVTTATVPGTHMISLSVTDDEEDRSVAVAAETINVLKERVKELYGTDNIKVVDRPSNAVMSQNASMKSRAKKSIMMGVALGVVVELTWYYVAEKRQK